MIRRAWLLHLGVVLGYVCAAAVFTWPLSQHLFTHLPGDPGGDTGVYIWNQWVFQHEALVERRSPLSTDQIFSLSQRTSLTPHNYTAFLNLLAVPLMPWLGSVATFNAIFLAMSVLTAYMTFLLARRVWEGVPEAWLAGLAFAWTPALVARSTGHMSLVAAAPLPAFLLCLVRAHHSGRVRDAALAGACIAWAAFCDVYYAVFCLMITGGYLALAALRVHLAPSRARVRWTWTLDLMLLVTAGLVVGLRFGRGTRAEIFGVGLSVRGLYTPVMVLTGLALARLLVHLRPQVTACLTALPQLTRFTGVAAAACVVLMAPLLWGVAAEVLEGNPLTPPIPWRSSPHGVDLLAFVNPNPNHPLARVLLGDHMAAAPTVFVEYTAAVSLVALAVVGIGAARAGFRPHAGWIWLAAGFALLSLGPFVHVAGVNTHVPGPWALLRYVPIVGAARMPTRFAILAALGLALLLAGALVAIGRRWPERRRLAVAVVAALLVFELWPAPRPLFSAAIPDFFHLVAADPRDVRVLALPFGFRDGTLSIGNYTARSQFHQTLHGKRLIGGYLSRISRRRVEALRGVRPTVDGLLTLSEGERLSPEREEELVARGPGFIERARLGYVVIDHAQASPELVRFAQRAFGLEPLAESWPYTLYRPHPAR
jgi:hypothetical protein